MLNGKWLARTLSGASLAVVVLCGTAGAAATQFPEEPPDDGKEEPRLTVLATGEIDEEKATRLSFLPIEMTGVEVRRLEGWLLPAAKTGETAPVVRIEAELVFENATDLPAISVGIEGIGSTASLQTIELKAKRDSEEDSAEITYATEVQATLTAPEEAETVETVTTVTTTLPAPCDCGDGQ